MIRQKLFTVEDNFKFSEREGIIVVGELEDNAPPSQIGSNVLLITPEGIEFPTKISGIEMPRPINFETFNWRKIGVMLKDITKKEDIPIGTEVFLNT